MTPITWTRKAAKMRDRLMADSPEYGFTVARRAVYLARLDPIHPTAIKVKVSHVMWARLLAGDEFMPDIPAERGEE